MDYLKYSLIGLLILFCYGILYKSLVLYLEYKKRYGDSIIIKFFPIVGFFYYFKPSFDNYNNSLHFFKEELRKNPKAKGILYLSGIQNWFVLTDNDWIKRFTQDQNKFTKLSAQFGSEFLFKCGIVNSEGNLWKRQRNFLNSSFHYNSLLNRVHVMKETASDFEDGLTNLNEFQKIDVFKQTQQFTSEVAVKSFFGKSFKHIKCNGQQYALELTKLTSETMDYRTTPFFIFKAATMGAEKASIKFNNEKERGYLKRIKDILEIGNKFIDERHEELKKEKNIKQFEPTNFLDMYLQQLILQESDKNSEKLQDYEKLSKNEILHQFFTLFFAGTDTTSHLSSMALFELSRNPDCLKKVREELKKLSITYDNVQPSDLGKLEYMTCLIKETLRYHPVTHLILPRKAEEDYVNGDLFISKNVVTTTRLIMQDESKPFLKDSDSFNPDRFLNADAIDPYDFIPFSAGSRNCIGQHMAILEAKLILLYVVDKFDIKAVDNYKLRIKQEVLLSPVDKQLIMIKKK